MTKYEILNGYKDGEFRRITGVKTRDILQNGCYIGSCLYSQAMSTA